MCDVSRCQRDPMVQYEAFGPRRKKCVDICGKHWEKHCDEEDSFDLVDHFYPPTRVAKKKK